MGPEPPTDVEFFEQAVELITAITSVPGGREELLRGLGHPGYAALDAERRMMVSKGHASGQSLPPGYSTESGENDEDEPWSNID